MDDNYVDYEWPEESLPAEVALTGLKQEAIIAKQPATAATDKEWLERCRRLRNAIDLEEAIRIESECTASVMPIGVVNEAGIPRVLYQLVGDAQPFLLPNIYVHDRTTHTFSVGIRTFLRACMFEPEYIRVIRGTHRPLPGYFITADGIESGTPVIYIHGPDFTISFRIDVVWLGGNQWDEISRIVSYDPKSGDGYILDVIPIYAPHLFTNFFGRTGFNFSHSNIHQNWLMRQFPDYKRVDDHGFQFLLSEVSCSTWVARHKDLFDGRALDETTIIAANGKMPDPYVVRGDLVVYAAFARPPYEIIFSLRGLGGKHTHESIRNRLACILNTVATHS